MNTIKCDMCGRTEPEVFARYSRKKNFRWFKRGGVPEEDDFPLDVCEGCWDGLCLTFRKRRRWDGNETND